MTFDVRMKSPNGINPFHLSHKAARVREFEKDMSRRIKSVEFVGHKPAQCILVDHYDHLYVTDNFIVTHNTLNFAWAYGVGPRALADNIEKAGQPRPKDADAKKWLDDFNEAYPTLVKWKEAVVRRARQLGYVPTIAGHHRRLPDLTSPVGSFRWAAERQTVNARIQGSAADMIKWAMIQLEPWEKMYGAKRQVQVHDELGWRCPKETSKEFAAIASGVMKSIDKHFNLIVPIEAEAGMGSNWAEAK
jgi:DNA polymerase I